MSGLGRTAIIARLGLDSKDFRSELKAAYGALDMESKKAASTGRAKFGGAGGNIAGATALQAQDVAVQLQMGTSAARVFAQQGSQILSNFGPHGAILGGVVAVGAAIYEWSTNMEAARKKAEQLEKQFIEAQKIIKETRATAVTDNEEANVLTLRRLAGDKVADAAEREYAYRRKIKEIEDKAVSSGMSQAEKDIVLGAAKKKYDAQTALVDAEHEKAALKASNQERERIVELEEQAADMLRELSAVGETAGQKVDALLKKWVQLNQAQKGTSAENWRKLENEKIKTQLEMARIAKEANTKTAADQESQATKTREHLEKHRKAQEKAAAEAKEQAEAVRVARGETVVADLELRGHRQTAAALRTKLDFEEKIRKARADGNEELAVELTKQKDLAMRSQAKGIVEANKFTLGELSGMNGPEAAKARQAMKEEARAERFRKRAAEGVDGAKEVADRAQGRADRIKNGLATLKESEKATKDAFRGALDETQVFKDIKANTDKLGVNL